MSARRVLSSTICALLVIAVPAAASQKRITSVVLTRPFFNPTLRESATLTVAVASPGVLSPSVLDRDGVPVRVLPTQQIATASTAVVNWNGRDDRGEIVPDEAYSFKLDFRGLDGVAETYFPAGQIEEMVALRADSYDRRSGVLRYTLPVASRVHIQAGSAVVDTSTGAQHGPVLKTVVNREPRTAGSVVEYWNGLDQSGTIRVPELRHFVISIAATPLPACSVIAIGNRHVTFVDWAMSRQGISLLPHRHGDRSHHSGLATLDDVSPDLRVTPRNAIWLEGDRVWRTKDSRLRLTFNVEGKTAAHFMKQPGRLMVFIDERQVLVIPASAAVTLNVPLKGTSRGTHVIAVDWVSDYGPVAAGALRIQM